MTKDRWPHKRCNWLWDLINCRGDPDVSWEGLVLKQGSHHSPAHARPPGVFWPWGLPLRWMPTVNVPANPYIVCGPFTCCMLERHTIPNLPVRSQGPCSIYCSFLWKEISPECLLSINIGHFPPCPLEWWWHTYPFWSSVFTHFFHGVDKSHIDCSIQTSLTTFRII